MADLASEFEKYETILNNWRKAITLLIEAWPEQAKMADFKNQTPLMLVAENGDTELTKLLLPFSDINAQDFIGGTALHASVMSKSLDCVSVILESEEINTEMRTFEGNNALHMAVRFGLANVVKLLTHEFPRLLDIKGEYNEIPLEMATNIYENYNKWENFMKSHNQKIGTKNDYHSIISILGS